MKKIKIDKLKVISIFLAFYFSVASTYNVGLNPEWAAFYLFIAGLTIILSPVFNLILNKCLKSELVLDKNNSKIKIKEIIIYFLVIFITFIVYFVILFPGGATFDTDVQWAQAMANGYNDWHPVLHTLLFHKLPSLFIAKIWITPLFQLTFVASVLTYMCSSLRKLGFNKKIVWLTLLITLLNPTTGRMALMVWKDIPYSYLLLVVTLMTMHIVKSKGKWLESNKNIAALYICNFFIIMFRHNGIICLLTLSIALFFLYDKKMVILIATLSVIAARAIVVGPIYKNFEIGKHSAPFLESVGIPLNHISYIINNDGNISKEEMDFLKQLGHIEEWKNYYNIRNFNYFKTSGHFDSKFLNENPEKFIKVYLSLVNKNKHMALISHYNVTSPLWSLDYSAGPTYIENENKNGDYTVKEKITRTLNYSLNSYDKWLNTTGIGKVIFGYGASLFLIIVSIGIATIKSKFHLRKYLPYIIVLINTLAISVLLTGGELRFVYSNIICAFPLLLYGLSNIGKISENDEKPTLLYTLFLDKTNNSFIQFFRYLFVGGFAAVVNIGFLFIFTDMFGIHYIISNILSFILGLITNYLLSISFVFNTEKVSDRKKEFIVYGAIGLIGLAIDTALMFILTSVFSIYYMISKVIATFITFIWNFIARKLMYKKEGKKYAKK